MAKISPKARISIDKFLSFAAQQNDKAWLEYCGNGALILKLIANQCDVSRSTFYDNDDLRKEVLKVGIDLLDKNIIERLPYEKDDKTVKHTKSKRAKDNKELATLQAENNKLQNKVSELQAQLNDKDNKLTRFEAMESILGRTGRMPR